jgi:hypothetical protein
MGLSGGLANECDAVDARSFALPPVSDRQIACAAREGASFEASERAARRDAQQWRLPRDRARETLEQHAVM